MPSLSLSHFHHRPSAGFRTHWTDGARHSTVLNRQGPFFVGLVIKRIGIQPFIGTISLTIARQATTYRDTSTQALTIKHDHQSATPVNNPCIMRPVFENHARFICGVGKSQLGMQKF